MNICLHLKTNLSRVVILFTTIVCTTIGWAFKAMDHFRSVLMLLFFNSQLHIESFVLYSLFFFSKRSGIDGL